MVTTRRLAGGALLSAAVAAAMPAVGSASTYSVTSIADSGAGTLRQAITDANAHAGADTVRFNLPGSGVRTIAITGAALPGVADPLVIDGKSQPGYAGSPLVRLDNATGNQPTGLSVATGQSQVLGLEVTRFGVGLRLSGDGNTVAGNLVGTNAAGDAGLGNGTGIRVSSGNGNRIGGTGGGAPNTVSGNTKLGIEIVGAATSATKVAGNRIGTDPTGTLARANPVGVRIGGGATANDIGGSITAGSRNLISGNPTGIDITGAGTMSNTVDGNYVGTNAAGIASLPNGVGVLVEQGASGNTIGGTTAGARNVISGNVTYGMRVVGSGTDDNVLAGNRIGTTAAGTAALPNPVGIRVDGSAASNTIGGADAGAGNLISGNTTDGLELAGGATANDAAGSASDNTLGGTAAGTRNVISGNTNYGVEFEKAGATGNTVAGNLIGVDATGTAKLGNAYGVYLFSDAAGNTIGGADPGARNVISGNERGVMLGSNGNFGAVGNLVAGNFIGTDINGTAALGNETGIWVQGAINTTLGGTTAASRNVISGNDTGVLLYRSAHNITIAGNYIGTNALASAAVGNGRGVYLYAGSDSHAVFGNTIGGSAAGAGNVISGNHFSGVEMFSYGGSGSNVVAGNHIGTDPTGTTAIGNGAGVEVGAGENGDQIGNIIGGTTAAARNVISGNGTGVALNGSEGSETQIDTTVSGNYIGTNEDGSAALSNDTGVSVVIKAGANRNVIGGSSAGARNVISGNTGDGVLISGDAPGSSQSGNDAVRGNYIGTKAGGGHPLGNGGAGVRLQTGALRERVEANRIAFNAGQGVIVDGTPGGFGDIASGNSILGNSMYTNGGLGIDLINGGNNDQAAPAITAVTTGGGSTTIDGTLASTASTTFRVELFSSPTCDSSGAGEGKTLLGSVDATTDGAGDATFSTSVPAVQAGQAVTATATSQPTGDTSEFSTCFASP